MLAMMVALAPHIICHLVTVNLVQHVNHNGLVHLEVKLVTFYTSRPLDPVCQTHLIVLSI